ncbi:choice-of-anchor I family protein [Paenibacillus silvisoli]|uniref:choice-of-anchor I family protein n=1 Tax=Paenibacillus silvisoli TaxID=3110539 RepID=UPI00280498F0|nr:choice-of-anchor I family protein [Paenibacillus silvisoli]
MRTRNKRLLSLLLSAEIAAGSLLAVIPASAAAAAPGTPYNAGGVYDVTVPHIVINQYYGSGTSTGGAANYGFIELYNPTDSDVNLSTWSIQYADRGDTATGATGAWQKLDLTGTIKAHSSYLIRAAESTSPSTILEVAKKDIDFTKVSDSSLIPLQNKGMKLVLMSSQTLLDQTVDLNPFATKPAGYVDMLGTGSNDKTTDIDGYESAYPAGPAVGTGPVGTTGGTSKNMSLRRVHFADTDNNKNDFVQVIYGDMTVGDAGVATYGPRSGSDGAWGFTPPPPSPLVVTTASLPDAAISVAYTAAVVVSGGTTPYAFSATGLPAGLAIDAATGVISGTPAADAPATNQVEVTITDGASASISKSFTLNVNTPHLDTVSITRLGSFIAGAPNEEGGVAEIVKYNPDNHSFYSVNGSSDPATLDIVSLGSNGAPEQDAKQINIETTVADHIPNFVYGDFTSVDIDTMNDLVYAAIQEEDHMKNGVILVYDYDGNFVKSYEAGVQPDMIKVTKDGRYVLTADEGEPRLNGDDPEGSITIVDTVANTVKHVKFDDTSVIDDLVHLRGTVDDKGIITGPAASKEAAVYDFEPEYIALSEDETIAYASLQESNAIATIDIAQGKVTSVKGLGYKDLNDPANSLDLQNKDGAIKFENVPFKGMYMPDGIDTYTVGGQTYVFTANEGDGTEWPGRTSVSTIGAIKGNLAPGSAAAEFLASKTVNGKTPYDSVEVPSDMGPDGIYMYGGRSFSIWNADTLAQVYDSHNDFEKITAERLPAYFNSDHKEIAFDKRSTKKGPEPEYVKVGKVGNKAFAFVGLERISGIMTYDVTNPESPIFANYTNTRNFGTPVDPANPLQTDAGPEGIEFIPATASPTGLPLILVANEVGGTISVLQMNVTKVTLDKASLALWTGDAPQQVAATVAPVGGNAATVTWSSSNTAVATVDNAGRVTPVGAGNAIITAISADGFGIAEAAVTVSKSNGGPVVVIPTPPVTTQPDKPVVDGSNVTTEAKAVTDSTGRAAAAVTGSQIEDALSKLPAAGNVEIKAVADSKATQNTITLPATAVDKIADSSALNVVVDAGIARVAFDRTALSTVSKAATTGDVSVSVARVGASDVTANLPAGAQAAVAAAIGSHPVYQFTVTADGKNVADFAGGTASIQVPYTPSAGEDINAIVIYYIADNGDLVMLPKTSYDVVTGTLSFQVKHFSNYAVAHKKAMFTDVAASFAKDHITYLSARNIIQGTSATSFSPKANVTRADFALILARIAGVELEEVAAGNTFSDVSADAYYAKAVAWAATSGITSGVSGSTFAPTASITREQMATMIARFAEYNGYALPQSAEPVTFADASSISAYAVEAAAAVQQAGIIGGTTRGNEAGVYFAPKQAATREETAKMLAVLYQGMTK